jgi:hypothetical protein
VYSSRFISGGVTVNIRITFNLPTGFTKSTACLTSKQASSQRLRLRTLAQGIQTRLVYLQDKSSTLLQAGTSNQETTYQHGRCAWPLCPRRPCVVLGEDVEGVQLPVERGRDHNGPNTHVAVHLLNTAPRRVRFTAHLSAIWISYVFPLILRGQSVLHLSESLYFVSLLPSDPCNSTICHTTNLNKPSQSYLSSPQ